MDRLVLAPKPLSDTTESTLAEPREHVALPAAEVATLRRENLELRQQAGYYKNLHARALQRIEKLQLVIGKNRSPIVQTASKASTNTSPGLLPCDIPRKVRPLPSTDVTRLPRYYEPLRLPTRPSRSLAGFWLIVARQSPKRISRVAMLIPLCRAIVITPAEPHEPG